MVLFVFCRGFGTARLEVGGVSLFCAGFALALRSFSRLRLFVSEARLSGYCVREGGVKGVNPGCL